MPTRDPAPRLEPEGRLLLGPGPSTVPHRVYEALGKPLVGHLDPQFLALMDEVQAMLRAVFRTDNRLTFAISGTGTAGMEACLANLTEPGDEVLVCVQGYFGERMCQMVPRVGGTLVRIDRPWGAVFEPAEVAAALDAHPDVALVAIVHAETSTGARQPLEELGPLCRERGKLLLVDAVTSLAGVPLEVDGWSIDACYSGTQKCLSCPPGLAPVTFGPRAEAKLADRASPPVSWYLDASLIRDYWAGGRRAYHHTAPVSMSYALHAALGLVLEEGLEARWARHAANARLLQAGLEALGLEPTARRGYRLPTLHAVATPAGIDEAEVRGELLERYGIEIGGGLGGAAGRAWRIGLMGESSRRRHVMRLLGALGEILHRRDAVADPGAGLAAASRLALRDEPAPAG